MASLDYDAENDVLYLFWGKKGEYERSLRQGDVIIDYRRDNYPIGVEIHNFIKKIEEFDVKEFPFLEVVKHE
jgi:uncharacterized protein YuzE